MPTDHFDRLGELAGVILAANDTIVRSGKIADAASGARYLVVQRHNIPFHLYAHPSKPEVALESTYRPSSVYDSAMTESDVRSYAQNVGINASNSGSLRKEVVNHRVMALNSEVDVDDAYEPIHEADSLTAPRVAVLPLDEYSDEPDGFAVGERLYPGEDEFSLSRYEEKVGRALDARIELSKELHRNLGLDDLSDDPSEQEPDEPGSGMEHRGFA